MRANQHPVIIAEAPYQFDDVTRPTRLRALKVSTINLPDHFKASRFLANYHLQAVAPAERRLMPSPRVAEINDSGTPRQPCAGFGGTDASAEFRRAKRTERSAAQRRVGMIVGACAQLEHAIAYLEWQLTAFSFDAENPNALPADRQSMLRAERDKWNQFEKLNVRLTRVTKAFQKPSVSARISQNQQLKEKRRQWETLRQKARGFGDKRNEIGHTFLSWSVGKRVVVREIGRPWNEQFPVSEAEDNELAKDIGALGIEIGRFTTELGGLLPFADDDQIITVG
jgi:hypothetical protein